MINRNVDYICTDRPDYVQPGIGCVHAIMGDLRAHNVTMRMRDDAPISNYTATYASGRRPDN